MVVLVLNLAVAVAKLAVGWLTGAISMVADGFHSLTDSLSNVVGLIGVSLASRPPDDGHPYGHNRFETLAALAIGGLLSVTALEILESCIERLRSGGTPEVTRLSFAVMAITIAVNLAVSWWERRQGESLGSEILKADAAHTGSDVLVSLSVIASLAAARAGYPQLDLVAALMITGVIAAIAYRILRSSAEQLVDAAAFPSRQIREVALAIEGVEGVHKIRTRGQAGEVYADLHVQVHPDLRIEEAHRIGHQVTDRLRQELGLRDVVAHVEPARRPPSPS